MLVITKSLELPADSRSDEITLQLVRCRKCRFEGAAVYEESRRGSLAGEAVDHRGYRMKMSDLQELKTLLARCPHPRRASCGCATHRLLSTTDKSGRWNGLAHFALGERFLMQIR
jgi:hypothetical protein